MKPHVILCYPVTDDSCIVAGAYASYMKYDELKRAGEEFSKSDPVTDVSTGSLQPRNTEFVENQWNQLLAMQDTWLAFFILSLVALAIVLLIVIFLRNQIRIAVALIKEASK